MLDAPPQPPANVADTLTPSNGQQQKQQQQQMLVLCGLIGSGKSTFAKALAQFSDSQSWVRCNQDQLGSRDAVYARARRCLEEGKNVIIDRTNVDASQRRTWLELAFSLPHHEVTVTAVTFATPLSECEVRLRLRQDHETITSVPQALRVLYSFASSYSPPVLQEGFHRTISLTPGCMSPTPTHQEISGILDSIHRLPVAKAHLPSAPPPPPPSARNRGRGRARGSGRGRSALYTPHGLTQRPYSNPDGIPPWRLPDAFAPPHHRKPWHATP